MDKRFTISFRLIVTALFTCALVVIGVLNVRDRIAWVDAYDGVFWAETDNGLTAERVNPDGPGYHAGIRVGNMLIAINEYEMPNLGVYAESLYATKHGDLVDYTVLTAVGSRSLSILLTPRNLFAAWDGVKTMLAFLFLGIGVFTALRVHEGWHLRTPSVFISYVSLHSFSGFQAIRRFLAHWIYAFTSFLQQLF